MTYALVFLAGIVLTVAVNRTRWAIFPLSGGPAFLSLLGDRPLGAVQELGRQSAREAFKKAADDVRNKAFCRGQRSMRRLATNALAAAGHPPEVFGIVAALDIDDDAPVPEVPEGT